ncbi:hypothetical protein A7A78_07970 [Aequorivita soesokkakensis]|jgi:hypothetical protein|uniref:Uncharacterized protein n=1 Tax=Aequorivita soesokkakensis TaxID=1385699 RepID=A0A1A9LAZ9_9FLAO|nr:hypothetical protein [Aequorivita soesokkakensis]OAD90144.1 hypothetical protein A7A78_07970 [Aequorivita soesokkakensis]
MARNKSFIKLEGTIDGMTFYMQDGENLVKSQTSLSKSKILSDSAFRRTRENMREFGGASRVGKAFREAFSGITKTMADTYMGARLNRFMKRINRSGSGLRGERDFNLVTFGDQLKGFEFNTSTPFDSQFSAPSSPPTVNVARDEATWVVPDFSIDAYITIPEGATHCRLVLAAGYVSNYFYNATLDSYVPDDESVDGRGGVSFSPDIPLSGMVGSDTTLVVDLSSLGSIPATSELFVGTGIIFYQEVNGAMYELAQGNAMKVATTG